MKHSRFELIVFDWDGTLMDSAALIVQAIHQACRDLGIAPPDEARTRHVIGLGLEDALQHALPELPAARYPELAQRYRHHYLAADQTLRLFAPTMQLLQALQAAGKTLAVATGKSRVGLQRAMAVTGSADFFAATRTGDDCFSKPHPQMLEQLMQELGVDAEHTLMVGDTTHDLNMAHNAGTAALAVAFGAHPRSALEQCQTLAILDQPEDLQPWFFSP